MVVWKVNRRSVALLVLLLVLSFVTGCASSAPPLVRAPEAAGQLLFFVRADLPVERNALWRALSNAGYSVIKDETRADVIVQLRVRKTQAVYLGELTFGDFSDYDARAELFSPDSQLLGRARYGFTDNEITSDDLIGLVNEMSRARILGAALRTKERRVAEHAQAEQKCIADRAEAERSRVLELRREQELRDAQAQAAIEQQKREEDAWVRSQPEKCKKPTSVIDCDGVLSFVRNYPQNAHVQEARDILLVASPKLEAIRDEQSWALANPKSCQVPTTDDACDGVERYLADFPLGRHSSQADRILARGKALIEQLRQAREARAEQLRQAREAREASPAPSYGDAGAFQGGSVVYPSESCGGGTVHVRGYFRRDGTYVRPHTRRAPRR